MTTAVDLPIVSVTVIAVHLLGRLPCLSVCSSAPVPSTWTTETLTARTLKGATRSPAYVYGCR